MIRHPRAFRPEATSLEPKLLLSVAQPLAQVTTLAATAQAANTVMGHYFAPKDMRAADAPLDANLDGSGKVDHLGRAKLTGSLQFGGLRTPGPDITGRVTLTNARGSVTLQLVGTGGNGPVADTTFALQASVVKGTGAYKNFRQIGTATVQFGPNLARSIIAPSPIGGNMTIQFHLKPPVR